MRGIGINCNESEELYCTVLHCTYCTVMYCLYCTWQVSPGGPGTISTLASSTAEQAAWPASSSVVRNQNRS